MDVFSLRTWFPDEFSFSELSPNEVFIAKGGAQDSTLRPYLSEGVVRVLDPHETDSLILEKRVNDIVDDKIREPAFASLVDEAGSTSVKISPNILYVRREGEDVFYGQEFLRDFSPFTDRSLNTLDDAEGYLESAGEVTGMNNWLGIAHGDMFQIYPTGPLRGLPKDKNLMFGPDYECVEIDMEDAHFADELFMKEDHTSGLVQMNVQDADDEYDALRETLMANIIFRHLPDYFDRVLESDLEGDRDPNTDLITVYSEDDPLMDEETYRIDVSRLLEHESEVSGEPNEKLVEDIRRLNRAYEQGVDRIVTQSTGNLDSNPRHIGGLIREAWDYSTIDTDITGESVTSMQEAAKKRWTEIYDTLEQL